MNPARSKTDLPKIEPATHRVRPPIALVAPPAPAVRARQLLHEARKASVEHLDAFESAVASVHELAEAVAHDEALYGPGLSDFARQFAEDLFWKSKTLEKLAQQQRLQLDAASA